MDTASEPKIRTHRESAETRPVVVADLCCGMGGLSLAARELGMRVVVGVDASAQVARTFSKNFPEAEFVLGSVRSPSVLRQCSELLEPPNDPSGPYIVLSGPPCQGFSAAGSRNPVDPRNQILVAVARAIAHLKPRCALIENVSMVLAKKHAKRLSKFKETLAQAGYFVHGLLLDAADFGVAQRRKRAFFLITRRPVEENQVQDRLKQLKRPELSVKQALQGLPQPEVRPDRYNDEEDRGVFANHLAMRHSKPVMEKIAALKPGTGPMSYRRLDPSRPSKTLFSGHRAPPAHFRQPRSITVREAARLQGFPGSFRVYGSFANQMEQVTNAVPPPLAKIVLQVLAELAGIATSAHA
jgi:DNA (cytosine-5)-methyltransferase 1